MFGKDAADVSLPELLQGLSKWEQSLNKDPQQRPFANLQRGADGKFNDDELVEILTSSIEDVSGGSLMTRTKTSVSLLMVLQALSERITYLNASKQ